MQAFVKSLLSRKLWLTVAAIIVLAANHRWTELVAAVIGYSTANVVEKVTGSNGNGAGSEAAGGGG